MTSLWVSCHDLLWDELARLHAQLGIDPLTATYTLEALEEEVIRARRAAQQPAIEGQAQFDSLPFDAPPEGGDHRSHKTWRNFYAAVFFGDQPIAELDRSTPSENGAGTGDTNGA